MECLKRGRYLICAEVLKAIGGTATNNGGRHIVMRLPGGSTFPDEIAGHFCLGDAKT